MADFTVSHVFSVAAAYAKAFNSYLSKAIFFPPVTIWNRWSQLHKHHAGPWAHLCYWTLAWFRNLQAQMFFCLESPHRALWKAADWLVDHSGLLEKSWSQAVRKKDQCMKVQEKERALFHFQSPKCPSVPFTPLLSSLDLIYTCSIQWTETYNRPCGGTDWQPKWI